MSGNNIVERVKEFLLNRKSSYQAVFAGPEGKKVLNDLARFCRDGKSTYDPDPRTHALLEGRREVLLRIKDHLNLTEEDLVTLYTRSK